MKPRRPSRRQVLLGALAALVSWLVGARPGTALAAAPAGPATGSSPAELWTRMTIRYDGDGNCLAVHYEPSAPLPAPARTVDALRRLTAYTDPG